MGRKLLTRLGKTNIRNIVSPPAVAVQQLYKKMPPQLSEPINALRGIRIPGYGTPCDLTIKHSPEYPDRIIASIIPNTSSSHDASPRPLLLHSLTHPHIHLDKAFIHGNPEYAHLLPSTGDFEEALSLTAQAKQQFTLPDLLKRGEWLIAESVAAGVLAMRAFVEVDHTVQTTCLEASRILKERWKDICEIQVVCFAQDPIFFGEYGEENRALMEEGISAPHVDVIGSTPYVESDVHAAMRNIDWAIDRALQLDRHVDFHLDYNLDRSKDPLVWYLLRKLRERGWTSRSTNKRVMLGHCTRLTLFSEQEWERLAIEIRENDLPVSFVGLPTSDLYMAAPPAENSAPHNKPRGTLCVPEMIRKHGLDAVVGVNNVGNAFTPWGSPDPLSLACLGVGVYQARTQADAELLYECVSTRARAAIGLPVRTSGSNLALQPEDSPDFMLVYHVDDTGCEAPRQRRSVAEVVWDPPERSCRAIVRHGRFVSKPMAEAGSLPWCG